MRPSARTTLALVLTAVLALALALPALAGAAAPPAQDRVFETWTAHMTGDSADDQGRVWLRETPCQQGFFFRLEAPCAKGEADHAIVYVGDEALVTIPTDKLAFAIVLDEWPAEGFGDPSPAYVGWGADDPSPDAVYAALRAGDFSVKVFDAEGGELLAGSTR